MLPVGSYTLPTRDHAGKFVAVGKAGEVVAFSHARDRERVNSHVIPLDRTKSPLPGATHLSFSSPVRGT